ncbi:MAG: phosphoribosyltransferase-like protein [Candidatus Hodarchaeales archaeon]
MKFRSYHLYKPWNSFFEHLFLYLKQFKKEDRRDALELVKNVTFFTQDEINRLSEIIFHQEIVPFLLEEVIRDEGLNPFDYSEAFKNGLKRSLKFTLFIALSDGANVDYFRRFNRLSNDNVISYYKLNEKAQKAIFKSILKESNDNSSSSLNVFFIEDFIGSGTTFIRENEDGKLSGQLFKFLDYWGRFLKYFQRINLMLIPYIITEAAINNIESLVSKYRQRILEMHSNVQFFIRCGIKLPRSMNVAMKYPSFERLCAKYYDPAIENEHTRIGGGVKFGFGKTGLAFVRYNNTPNNSIYLLWNPKSWNPIFPRISRHGIENNERKIV